MGPVGGDALPGVSGATKFLARGRCSSALRRARDVSSSGGAGPHREGAAPDRMNRIIGVEFDA